MKELKKKAERRLKQLETRRKDPRYLRVAGRLVRERLLLSPRVLPSAAHPTLEEALWAGEEVEPRILELLPALVFRRPKLFVAAGDLPQDLAQVVRELRRGNPQTPFRGIPAASYAQWVDRVARVRRRGGEGRGVSISKTHRFTQEDLSALAKLQERWGVDETAAIRMATKLLPTPDAPVRSVTFPNASTSPHSQYFLSKRLLTASVSVARLPRRHHACRSTTP